MSKLIVITIIALDLAFVLLGETVHILRQSSYRQREQRISQEILDLNDAISKDMATYSGLIGFVLNEVSVSNSAAASWDIITYMKYSGLIDSVLNKKVDYNEACGFLTPHFPDSKSLLCGYTNQSRYWRWPKTLLLLISALIIWTAMISLSLYG